MTMTWNCGEDRIHVTFSNPSKRINLYLDATKILTVKQEFLKIKVVQE
jgi:hypothetical protein